MFLNNILAQQLYMIYVGQGIADPKTALDIVTSMSDSALLKNIRLFESPKLIKKAYGGVVNSIEKAIR